MIVLRSVLVLLLCAGLSLESGCSENPDGSDPEVERFLSLGWPEQVREIKKQTPARQIELLSIEHERGRPFNSGLREAVAAGGEQVLPEVRRVLERQPTNFEKRDLLCVLLYMETSNFANVADNSSIMELAEVQAQTLTGQEASQATNILETIRAHRRSAHAAAEPGKAWEGLLAAKDGC